MAFPRGVPIQGFSFTLISKIDGSDIVDGTCLGYVKEPGQVERPLSGVIAPPPAGSVSWTLDVVSSTEADSPLFSLIFKHPDAITREFVIATYLQGSAADPTTPTPVPGDLLCMDMDVANRCRGDFARLASRSCLMAKGDDGRIGADGWTLVSDDNNFEAQGVIAGMIVVIQSGGVQADDELEIAIASGNTIVMKRLGVTTGQGKAPLPADAVDVSFECRTVVEEIATATRELREEYGFATGPAPTGYEETFKQLCICMILRNLYREMARQSQGQGDDYIGKFRMYQACIDAHEKRLGALFEVDIPGGVPFSAPLPTRDARPLFGPWPDAHPYDLDWRGRR